MSRTFSRQTSCSSEIAVVSLCKLYPRSRGGSGRRSLCQRGPNSAPAGAGPLPQYRARYPISVQKIATPGSHAAATDRRHATASVRAAIVRYKALNRRDRGNAPHDKNPREDKLGGVSILPKPTTTSGQLSLVQEVCTTRTRRRRHWARRARE